MKRRINATIDENEFRDFVGHHGTGNLSRFLEEKLREENERMRLMWWLICPSCKERSHIRAVLNRGGFCTKSACGAKIAEKIE